MVAPVDRKLMQLPQCVMSVQADVECGEVVQRVPAIFHMVGSIPGETSDHSSFSVAVFMSGMGSRRKMNQNKGNPRMYALKISFIWSIIQIKIALSVDKVRF